MRKFYKTMCLDALKVLSDAHAELTGLIGNKDIEGAMDLLEQCQQGAISVGTTVDKFEGEGTEEVAFLEQYCEVIFRTFDDLQNGLEVNTKQLVKKLEKPLTQALNGISTHLPTEKEVVFLPYKASMWDSLESVYKEMSADPLVNAIVIPIPYYDKNPDGSMREMHYEIDKFPKDVPVTDFNKYILSDKHPEAIYIHNPYDADNYVTSVLPAFYSSELKKYTDELVYIPYFVLDEIDPSDEKALEGVEHFIALPAVVNAHRVIVQSENWRKAYIEVMCKYFNEETRPYWEAKIEAGGSPKLKRVAELKDSDFVLPPEWERVVNKPDGTRKKIVFYNIGVTAMINENEKMLDKIERVLQIFKDNSAEVALLFRPHPLMQATLTSMRPELWDKYEKIISDYRSEGWGIYDDSPELDRAIALSDAYYGDPSSVVQLYRETKKPIMIQNADV